MPKERFFTNQELNTNDQIEISGQEFHHLAHVMRIQENEEVELVNGQGILGFATLVKKDKKSALFLINDIYKENLASKKIILAQALPRINRLDMIIEKATELNVTEIWLFPGTLSERKTLTDHQIERLEGLSIAAMKQCGRLFLPKIKICPSLDKWKEFPIYSYFGDVSDDAPHFLKAYKQNEDVLFFIGPESGFTEKEESLLKTNHVKGVKLHQNILRTDTAAIVALSLIH